MTAPIAAAVAADNRRMSMRREPLGVVAGTVRPVDRLWDLRFRPEGENTLPSRLGHSFERQQKHENECENEDHAGDNESRHPWIGPTEILPSKTIFGH
jgi:hypothetical protein